jgi:hypothetical protein
MYQRILTALTAGAILLAFAMPPGGSALAQKIEPTTDSKNLNSSRSNVDRMGGGGGAKAGGAATTTVKSDKSNTSDRMGGGGGGKGAVQLNPQPEPPGRR